MPETLKVLIIENDKNDIQIYLDTIKTVNSLYAGDIIIEPTVKDNEKEGKAALTDENWAAAFIDLKLTTGDILAAQEGNEIVREIYRKKRFPVYVLSNTPEDVSKEFQQSIFLKIDSKTNLDYTLVFEEIIKIHKTGILNILGKKGIIERYLDEIFWNNISHSLLEWYPVESAEKPLLRHTLLHLQEYLELSDDGKEFDIVMPIENYITPSIKDYFFTGDIINSKSNKLRRFVILTPACDLAPHSETKAPKTKEVLLAELQPLSEGVFRDKVVIARKAPKNKEEEGEVETAKSDLGKLIGNNFSPKYYYLPNTSIVQGGLINFQKLSSVKLSDIKGHYEKAVTISSPFVKDIIAKFSFYYSRQGSPDFDFVELAKSHLK